MLGGRSLVQPPGESPLEKGKVFLKKFKIEGPRDPVITLPVFPPPDLEKTTDLKRPLHPYDYGRVTHSSRASGGGRGGRCAVCTVEHCSAVRRHLATCITTDGSGGRRQGT